ncbi:MAG: sporulation protein YqfD, partial [Oscillospiraceae bacterium]
MIFLKIIRYICGYVMFQCTGVFCEKFINMAKEQGIFFWDLSKKNVALTGFVRKSDYKKLRKI